MAANREPVRETAPRLVLQALTWVAAVLVFIVPLSGKVGSAVAAAAAIVAVVLAQKLVTSRCRWPWIVLLSAILGAMGLASASLVGGAPLVARLLGPGLTLKLIESLTFGLLAFGGVLALRTLTLQAAAACAFLEAATIAMLVTYSFRGHRQYPFSQPQVLSDWALITGYDPRHVLMAIGMVTLVGVGLLLLPRQGLKRTLLAAILILLVSWLALPILVNGTLAASLANSRQPAPQESDEQATSAKSLSRPEKPDPDKEHTSPKPKAKGDKALPPPSVKPKSARPNRPPPLPPPVPPELLPTIAIGDAKVEEGNAGTTTLAFPVRLSAPLNQPVHVNFRTSAGTATESDFQPVRGTITIPAGQTQALLNVPIQGDTEEEPDENLFVLLSNPIHARLEKDRGQGLIINDDHDPPPPKLSISDVKVVEGNAGTTAAVFVVTLSEPSLKRVQVGYAAVAGTAELKTDFQAAEGQLTIPPGQTQATITSGVSGDTTVESDETYVVRLTKPVNAVIARGEAIGVIVNDDVEPPPPTLSINDTKLNEGHSGKSLAAFAVTLSAPSMKPVQVTFGTTSGTAKADEDYVSRDGNLTIPPGETRAALTVEVFGDTTFEAHEAFILQLVNPVNATLARDRAVGIILNDDREPGPPTISINDIKFEEGKIAATVVFAVTLSAAATQPVQVRYSAVNGSAIADADFRLNPGVLMIPVGETRAELSVEIVGDEVVEPDELFQVVLANPVGAILGRATGNATIINDDQLLLSVDDVKSKEGDVGATPFTFSVSLSGKSTESVQVAYSTIAGTAKMDQDFRPAQGTLTIPPGETRATFNVEVLGEKAVEADEDFIVQLSQPVRAGLARARATAVIVNDDDDKPPPEPDMPPTISIHDEEWDEGDSGIQPFAFRITLSTATNKEVKVDYATASDTATAGMDFRAKSATLTFPPGATEARVTIEVVGDVNIERDEEFQVLLSNPVNGKLESDTGIGTIINDDKPSLTIEDVKREEGNDGTTQFEFPVKLSEATPEEVKVDYATRGVSAEAEQDFVPVKSTLIIPAGMTQAAVAVAVRGDTAAEVDEVFEVELSNASQATIARGTGKGTIVNDDLPKISIEDAKVEEGNGGTTPLELQVTLSGPTNQEVSVDYATSPGTAKADQDFRSRSGTVRIPAGETRGTVSIDVVADTVIEPNEDFTVKLSNPRQGTLDRATATGTILNDDKPLLSIDDVSVKEGHSGVVPMKFTVSVSEAITVEIRVSYEALPKTAARGKDFRPSQGTLTIPAGQTKGIIQVEVVGDVEIEPGETLELVLSNPSEAKIERGTGVGTIVNDDQPKVSVADARAEEGNAGVNPLTFIVKLSARAYEEVSVKFDLASRTATIGNDFQSMSDVLKIPAGQTEAPLAVSIIGDTVVEPDEMFNLRLLGAENATLERDLAAGTIVNDDVEPPIPDVSVDDIQVDEGHAGTVSAKLAVLLSEPTTNDVQVKYETIAGTAEGDKDYRSANGVLTVRAGQVQANLTIEILGDTDVEPDETFQFRLSAPVRGKVKRGEARITIRNDDQEPPLPDISIDDVKLAEGNEGEVKLQFTVTLSHPSQQEVTVAYAMGGGTAQPDEDYRPVAGTLRIPAGQDKVLLDVHGLGDTVVEGDETFEIQLTSPKNANLQRDKGIGTIVNDDDWSADAVQEEDEFDWGERGPPPLAPQMLVKFHDDYVPLEKGFYFRTRAYSRLQGTRLLRDEARDADIVWAMPSERLNLPNRPPQHIVRDLSVTAYLIGSHETPPALLQAAAFEPQVNPAPEEFSSVFVVTSQVLTHGRRGGRVVDGYGELSSAKVGDPAWDEAARRHYVVIPEDRRYRDLAREISNSLDARQRNSAFARALAIRKWMERNLTYDYNPAHQQATDRTASYLFGDRRGTCVHLAHAMTFLLRAQDMPARVAVGYRVAPERRGQRGALLAYASDQHAWAEMYFEGVGWVAMESATKGRIPPPDADPDPREIDHYLSLLGDVPAEVYASEPTGWPSLRRVAAVGGVVSVSGMALALYVIKLWRLLIPLFASPAVLHRVGYRAVLDRLAAAGLRRQYGETWDDFAVRVRDIVPEFERLTELHLRRTFGGGEADRSGWLDLQTRVTKQIAEKVPAVRRWLGLLNPVSWM